MVCEKHAIVSSSFYLFNAQPKVVEIDVGVADEYVVLCCHFRCPLCVLCSPCVCVYHCDKK